MTAPIDTLVTVFGGSGFLGRHVVRALAQRDYRLRVGVRRPELAGHLQPLGKVGQINPVQANIRYPASIEAAMRGAHVVVNLVGILSEGGAQRFNRVHAHGAHAIAEAAAKIGARMVHVSAIGADVNSTSRYAVSKAFGEQAVLDAVPGATIIRPSIVFGPEDHFANRFLNTQGRVCFGKHFVMRGATALARAEDARMRESKGQHIKVSCRGKAAARECFNDGEFGHGEKTIDSKIRLHKCNCIIHGHRLSDRCWV